MENLCNADKMLDSKGIKGDFRIYRTFLKIRAKKCEFAAPEKKFGQNGVNSPHPTKIRAEKCEFAAPDKNSGKKV